jgi:hypothetical protein
MSSRTLLSCFLVLVCSVSVAAQTSSSSLPETPTGTIATNEGGPEPAPQAQQTAPARDPIDIKVQEALRQRDAIIRNLLERVSELEWRVNGGFTTKPTQISGGNTAAQNLNSAVANSAYSTVANAGYDIEERQASEALDRALLVRGGLLLPSGMIEFDHTTSYYSTSSDHVTVNGFALLPVLVVGDITSERVRNDILLPTFTTRLGLPWRLQADMTIPYGYILNRTVDANNVESDSSSFGLGDIQFGVSRQLTFEKGRVPDLLANVRFKTTTGEESFDLGSSTTSLGSGFYAIQGNLTAAKTSDPVVFYGNLSYTYNFSGAHTITNPDPTSAQPTILGHFRPGSAVGFQLGTILAVNPETSVTFGWDQRWTQSTSLDGSPIPASYLVEGTLRLGTTYLYAPGKIIDLTFGVGLTPDTPNLQFSVGFPFRFNLWNRSGKTM